MSPEPPEKMRGSIERSRRARARSRRHLLVTGGLGLIGVGALVACRETQTGPHQLPKKRLRPDRGTGDA